MPDSPAHPQHAAIEAILRDLFPAKFLMDAAMVATSFDKQTTGNSHFCDFNEIVDSERTKLLSLPEAELTRRYQHLLTKQKLQKETSAAAKKAMQEADAAKKEAAKFYNLPHAQADFNHWLKAEYWTFDESISLLLGKEPTVVTRAAVKNEAAFDLDLLFSPEKRTRAPGFIASYNRLRALAERATVMQPPRLKPTDVIHWAKNIEAVVLPVPLAQHLVSHIAASVDPGKQVIPETQESAQNVEVAQPPKGKGSGSPRRWSDAELEKLRKYRLLHNAKETAQHFDISTARIRQLLPSESPKPTSHNPFGLAAKKRY